VFGGAGHADLEVLDRLVQAIRQDLAAAVDGVDALVVERIDAQQTVEDGESLGAVAGIDVGVGQAFLQVVSSAVAAINLRRRSMAQSYSSR